MCRTLTLLCTTCTHKFNNNNFLISCTIVCLCVCVEVSQIFPSPPPPPRAFPSQFLDERKQLISSYKTMTCLLVPVKRKVPPKKQLPLYMYTCLGVYMCSNNRFLITLFLGSLSCPLILLSCLPLCLTVELAVKRASVFSHLLRVFR